VDFVLFLEHLTLRAYAENLLDVPPVDFHEEGGDVFELLVDAFEPLDGLVQFLHAGFLEVKGVDFSHFGFGFKDLLELFGSYCRPILEDCVVLVGGGLILADGLLECLLLQGLLNLEENVLVEGFVEVDLGLFNRAHTFLQLLDLEVQTLALGVVV